MICQLRLPIKVGWGHIFRACGDYYTWTNELIDNNPKYRLFFFKIDIAGILSGVNLPFCRRILSAVFLGW
jgi:hypothetical protein